MPRSQYAQGVRRLLLATRGGLPCPVMPCPAVSSLQDVSSPHDTTPTATRPLDEQKGSATTTTTKQHTWVHLYNSRPQAQPATIQTSLLHSLPHSGCAHLGETPQHLAEKAPQHSTSAAHASNTCRNNLLWLCTLSAHTALRSSGLQATKPRTAAPHCMKR